MSILARKIMLACLVAAFLAQTWLVYSDATGTEHTLSPEALAGQAVWRGNNCQSCHQLFGFGGFLGPDLTNAAGAITPARMESVLTVGSGQMPAFELDVADRSALITFLEEIDETGIGQVRLGEVMPPAELMRQIVDAGGELSDDVMRGAGICEAQACLSCHLPNTACLHLATCLTTMADSVERERLFTVLHDGIAGKAMPPLGLSPDDSKDVLAYLQWLSTRGEEVRRRFESQATAEGLSLSKIPWFEY